MQVLVHFSLDANTLPDVIMSSVSVSSEFAIHDVTLMPNGESSECEKCVVMDVLVDTRRGQDLLLVLGRVVNIRGGGLHTMHDTVKVFAMDSWACLSSYDLDSEAVNMYQLLEDVYVYCRDRHMYRLTSVTPLVLTQCGQTSTLYRSIAVVDPDTLIGLDENKYMHLVTSTGDLSPIPITGRFIGFSQPLGVRSKNRIVAVRDSSWNWCSDWREAPPIDYVRCMTVSETGELSLIWKSQYLGNISDLVISVGVVIVSMFGPSRVVILDLCFGTRLRTISLSSIDTPALDAGMCIHNRRLFIGCGRDGVVAEFQLKGKLFYVHFKVCHGILKVVNISGKKRQVSLTIYQSFLNDYKLASFSII
jgi:hypothetical protein